MSKRTLYAIVDAWGGSMYFVAETEGGRFDWAMASAKSADFGNDSIAMFPTTQKAEQHAQQIGVSACKIVPIGRSDES